MRIPLESATFQPMTADKIPNDGFNPLPAFGAAPEPDFTDSVCLKGVNGRCDHLWQLTTSFAHGNTAGTFEPGKEPRAIHRSCLRSPSEEMELKGLTVHTCSSHSDPDHRVDPPPFDFSPPEPEPAADDDLPPPIDGLTKGDQ
jgi:hypothetical protein